MCWYGKLAGAKGICQSYHYFAGSDDASSTPESHDPDTLGTPPVSIVAENVADVSHEVVLDQIPEAGKQALHYDTSSESDVAELEDESDVAELEDESDVTELEDESDCPLQNSLLASCAVHACFMLKCSTGN